MRERIVSASEAKCLSYLYSIFQQCYADPAKNSGVPPIQVRVTFEMMYKYKCKHKQNYKYNYNNEGNGSHGYESGSSMEDCGAGNYGNDRTVTVTEDTTLATVCWSSCEECPDQIFGCTDSNASNYDSTATDDDGSCSYPAPMQNLFFSEHAEGSSNNKYFEIYNPSDVVVSLSDYSFVNCANACDNWEYETDFADGAVVSPGGVYSV